MAKRLGKEWANLEAKPDEQDRFFAEAKNSDLEWVMKILIADDAECCYAEGIYTVVLTFPSEYPFKPPTVKFTPPVYHPGINQETGEICADVLNEEWGPTRNVRWIMGEVLYNMFLTEGTGHTVNADIMKEKEENYEVFQKKVKDQIAELED